VAVRPCIVCGALTRASRCPAHTLRNGSSRAWRDVRAYVLARDGRRCTAVEEGRRCPVTAGLEVDHEVALADGGLNRAANLTTLCQEHHRRKSAARL
jgi:5-methylcytosine-specific restriction endonuclease McrA